SSALKSTPQSKIDNRKLTPVAAVSLSRRSRAKGDDRRSRASTSVQGTFHTNLRFVQHMRVNHPRKKRLTTNRVFLQVMSKLDLEKTPTSAAFEVSFTSERICLLGVCLVVNQLPLGAGKKLQTLRLPRAA